MAMLERSERQKVIGSTVIIIMLAAAVVFAALVIADATKLGGATASVSTETVTFGPLKLIEFQKKALEGGGYEVSFVLLKGLLGYIVFWLVAFVGVAYSRIQKRASHKG